MAEIIRPDLGFVKKVMRSGGGDLKKCYQCSTCTVVCNVTQDKKPFPRKEMLYAQWGLKDKLFSNPDIWLCHQCSDCTAYCPRGAKPGEVINAIRRLSLEHYSKPSFLARAVNDIKYFVFLMAVPVLIFLSYLSITGKLDFNNVPRDPEKGIVYSNLIPTTAFIDPVFIAAALFAVIVLVSGIKRYWKDMSENAGVKGGDLKSAIIDTLKEILAHRRFNRCSVTSGRAISHLLVFYSFVGLAITTTLAFIYLYGLKRPSPYPLYDPMKIIGNISAIGLLVGILLVIVNRLKNYSKAGIGSYYDWLFIFIVFSIMATGILSELLRLADVASLAYSVYIAHLSFVFFLFAYAPFSKMAHMLYRATAMVFARYASISPKVLIDRSGSVENISREAI